MVTITQKGTKTLLQDVCCVSVSPKYNKSLLQSVGWDLRPLLTDYPCKEV